jgi:hypothetical protein
MRRKFDRTPLRPYLQDIKNLYEGGTSTAKIAEKYNSNGESVRLILKKMELKLEVARRLAQNTI